MIFKPPPKKKGRLIMPALRNKPASKGEQAVPIVRAIPVTPAAAERSEGSTTATT